MMLRPNLFFRCTAVAGAVAVPAAAAWAAPDTLMTVVDRNTATGGAALGTFAYDPANGAFYVTGFGASGELRRVTSVNGTPTAQTLVTQTQWTLFNRDGDPNRSGGQPTVSGMLLNPVAVGNVPAFGGAWLIDGGGTVRDGTVNRNDLTQRLYRFNLQPVAAGQDGRSVFTSLTTKAETAAVIGQPANTSSSDTVGRQFVWSGDGQSIFFVDSSTTFGGLWQANAATGDVARLYANADLIAEPAVLPAAGGGDRVLFNGTAATGNVGGVDAITRTGTTTSAPAPLISAAALAEFLELPANGTADVRAMAGGPDGSVYLWDLNRKVLVRRDAQGRLAKVVSKAERDAFFGVTTNNGVFRMQPRTVSYTNASATFDVTQVLYGELSNNLSVIAGAYDFKTGDFNRDNAFNAADVALFKPTLTIRGTPIASADNLRYDLNGNGAADWRDVKVLQQFYPFDDGDADINQAVNYADLDAMNLNYLGSGKIWTQGDFTGDNATGFADLLLLAANWDLAKPTEADLDARGYTGTFRDDVITAFNIPEPVSMAWLGAGLLALLRRRRRQRAHREVRT